MTWQKSPEARTKERGSLIDPSVAHDRAHDPGSVLERIEEEIHRLRERRPALEGVLDRATGIITTHLACRRQRVIVVRVGLDGRYKFLFSSLRDKGATYVINPSLWSCSCPAHHRTGGPCKHSIAAYVLWRAARPLRKLTCSSCGEKVPSSAITEVQEEQESLSWSPGDRLCTACLNDAGGIA